MRSIVIAWQGRGAAGQIRVSAVERVAHTRMYQTDPKPEIWYDKHVMPASPLNQFREFLQNKGLRLTRERALVARLVFASMHRGKITEQFRVDSAALIRVSRATIYRTIWLLKESGLVPSLVLLPQSKHQATRSLFWNLCERTHDSQIAGRCPWCGRELFEREKLAFQEFMPRQELG